MSFRTHPNRSAGFEQRLFEALTALDEQRQPAVQHLPAGVPGPRSGRWRPRRVRKVAMLAAALAALLAASAAAVASLSLSEPDFLEPDGTVVRGKELFVKGGSRCRVGPENPVSFTLDGRPLRVIHLERAGRVPDLPYFSATVAIPAGTSPGRHQLAARCTGVDGKPRNLPAATVQVLATTPPEAEEPAFDAGSTGGPAPAYRGAPGLNTGVSVKGKGCRKGSRVAFTLDGRPVRADIDLFEGGFAGGVTIPQSTGLGVHDLAVRCTGVDGRPLVQQAKIRVLPPEPERLVFAVEWFDPAVPGGTAGVKGYGCRPGSRVTLTLDGAPVEADLRADGGAFHAEVPVPSNITPGTHELAARCRGTKGQLLRSHDRLHVRAP
jgi:hypothetical protein